MTHPINHAAQAAFFSGESDTPPDETGRPGSGIRAKSLPLGNSLMHARRIRAVRVLSEILSVEKEIVRACMLGVSRALVARWLDRRAVDKNPAPLAVLWALVADEYSDVVRAPGGIA